MKRYFAPLAFLSMCWIGIVFPAFTAMKGTYNCFDPEHQRYSPLHGCIWIETRLLQNLFMFGSGVKVSKLHARLAYTADKDVSDHTIQLIHELFSIRPGDLDVYFWPEESEHKITALFSPGVIAHFLQFIDVNTQKLEQLIPEMAEDDAVLNPYVEQFLALIESGISEEKSELLQETIRNEGGTLGRRRFNHLRRIIKHFVLAQQECLPRQQNSEMIRYLPYAPTCIMQAFSYQKSKHLGLARHQEFMSTYLRKATFLLESRQLFIFNEIKDHRIRLTQIQQKINQLTAHIREVFEQRKKLPLKDVEKRLELNKVTVDLYREKKELRRVCDDSFHTIQAHLETIRLYSMLLGPRISRMRTAQFGQNNIVSQASILDGSALQEASFENLAYTLLLKNIYQGALPIPVTFKDGILAHGQEFTDCVETTFRNFANMVLYDPVAFQFILGNLPARTETPNWRIAHVMQEFYERNFEPTHANNQEVHNAWATVVSGIDGISYELQGVEINPTEGNFVHLWNTFFLDHEQRPVNAPTTLHELCEQLGIRHHVYETIFYEQKYTLDFQDGRRRLELLMQRTHMQMNFEPHREEHAGNLKLFRLCLEQTNVLESCNIATCAAPTLDLASIIASFDTPSATLPPDLITSYICTKHLHHPAGLLSITKRLLTLIPTLKNDVLKMHLTLLTSRFIRRLITLEEIYKRPFYTASIITHMLDMNASESLPQLYEHAQAASGINAIIPALRHIFTTYVVDEDLTTDEITLITQASVNNSVEAFLKRRLQTLTPEGKAHLLISIIEQLVKLGQSYEERTISTIVEEIPTIHPSFDIRPLLQLGELNFDARATVQGINAIVDYELYDESDDFIEAFVHHVFVAFESHLESEIDEVDKDTFYSLIETIARNLYTQQNVVGERIAELYPNILNFLRGELVRSSSQTSTSSSEVDDFSIETRISKILYHLIGNVVLERLPYQTHEPNVEEYFEHMQLEHLLELAQDVAQSNASARSATLVSLHEEIRGRNYNEANRILKLIIDTGTHENLAIAAQIMKNREEYFSTVTYFIKALLRRANELFMSTGDATEGNAVLNLLNQFTHITARVHGSRGKRAIMQTIKKFMEEQEVSEELANSAQELLRRHTVVEKFLLTVQEPAS